MLTNNTKRKATPPTSLQEIARVYTKFNLNTSFDLAPKVAHYHPYFCSQKFQINAITPLNFQNEIIRLIKDVTFFFSDVITFSILIKEKKNAKIITFFITSH